MSPATQRRRDTEREVIEFTGRTDFPDSKIRGKDADNNIPLYGVMWMYKGRRTGNSWTNKAKAISVMEKKQAEGAFVGTYTAYCAGFAF